MPRKKRAASPSSDDEDGWSDVLVGPDMDLLLQAGELVDLTYNLAGVEAGVDAAAGLVQHLMPPARFRQLVEAWRGREGPGRGCSGKELSRWKHLSSIAVDAVARAALQGKVGELEAKIQQRQALKAAAAEAEAKLAAALAAMQEDQGEEALQSPSEDTAGGAAAAAAEAADVEISGLSPGFGAAAAGMVELSARKQGAAAGAGVCVASTARQHAPGGAAAAAGAAVPVGSGGILQHTQQISKQQTLSGLYRKADVSHQASQQNETGALPLQAAAPAAIVGKWTGTRTNGSAATSAPASNPSQLIDADYELLWDSEAAAAAVKAAMEKDAAQEQLAAELRSQGCPVLPEEGRMTFANKHLIFKTRMQVTCFMSPSYVDDKAAGAKKHMDNLLFTYLDDQQAILLAYENLDVQLNTAFLHPEPPPLLTVKAAADVTTFEPTPGDIICGVVSKLSHNAITLTVLGCISVAIERQHIPPDWEYDLSAHCWVPGGDYTCCVLRGDRLACMIMTHPKQDPDEEEVLFNLEGTLLVPHTGLCPWQWPKQQRLRGLLAALNSQGEYDEQRDNELQAQQQELQQELQQEGLACKVLVPLDADPQQLQQLMMTGQRQQRQQRHHSGSKDERHAAKEAAKAAAKAEKQRLKEAARVERHAAKAAEKAARKEARRAEKAAAKAAEKAAKAAAKAEKRTREQQQSAPAADQPPAKKHRQHHSSEQQQQDAAAAAAAAAAAGNVQEGTQQQPGSTHSKEKHKKHKEHKSSHKDDKKKKAKKDKKKDKST